MLSGPTAPPDYAVRLAALERVCGQRAEENAARKKRCSGSSPSPALADAQPAAGVPQLVAAPALRPVEH
jgi:hypothetical protein